MKSFEPRRFGSLNSRHSGPPIPQFFFRAVPIHLGRSLRASPFVPATIGMSGDIVTAQGSFPSRKGIRVVVDLGIS